ncbi:molybdopterin adenylyltransferase [Bosea sp. TWI1241]|uniref:molybdopterin adenylyltransferase n=1 Tax=Bosea sp. TWI1241 TaxID=3148904 RepID=UPI0032095FE2
MSSATKIGPARIGIVTVSDRASAGIYPDEGGPAIADYLMKALASPWQALARIVPDDRGVIAETLTALADSEGCCLVVTTGGTGPAPRDVTPEATEDVIEKPMPGFGELMRQVSLAKVPTAILSRQTAGIRGGCLIVNLPGRPRAIAECLDAVMPAIPYCIDLIGGPRLETDPAVIAAFRPGEKSKP